MSDLYQSDCTFAHIHMLIQVVGHLIHVVSIHKNKWTIFLEMNYLLYKTMNISLKSGLFLKNQEYFKTTMTTFPRSGVFFKFKNAK